MAFTQKTLTHDKRHIFRLGENPRSQATQRILFPLLCIGRAQRRECDRLALLNSPVLVIGASGFVGCHVTFTLENLGYRVIRGTSNQQRCTRADSTAERWTYIDLNNPGTFQAAFAACKSVVYLYHGLGTGNDYAEREARIAHDVRRACEANPIRRLVYLGGVVPQELTSRHLESRRRTGAILREGSVSTIELRAAMVIGRGSTSFGLIRDLAVRLPALALPPWMDRGSYPVAIEDVVYCIIRALELETTASECLELPGPEWVTHRELITRLAALLGTKMLTMRIPFLSTRRAARLLSLITARPSDLVGELVEGLPSDLTPTGVSIWERLGEIPVYSVTHAMLNALADETSRDSLSPAARARLQERVATSHRSSHK